MAHTINQAGVVESILMQQRLEVSGDLFLVLPVPHGLFHVLEHLDDLDIRAAVFGALQGT